MERYPYKKRENFVFDAYRGGMAFMMYLPDPKELRTRILEVAA
jgi:hypothetical protein